MRVQLWRRWRFVSPDVFLSHFFDYSNSFQIAGNDISAKNLNLLIGCLLLLCFLASLPRWIDFFAARGKGMGWSLTKVARSTTTQLSDHLDEKEYYKKEQDVKIEVKESCRARLPKVMPTGAFTSRRVSCLSSLLAINVLINFHFAGFVPSNRVISFVL